MSILGLIIVIIFITICILYKKSEKYKKYIEIIFPLEVIYTIEELLMLLKKKPYYIIFFITLIPIVSLTITLMFFIGSVYFLKTTIIFIYYYIAMKIKKKKNILKYKEWKTNFKNIYLIVLKKIFYEKPTTTSFYILYNILKDTFEKKKNKQVYNFFFFMKFVNKSLNFNNN